MAFTEADLNSIDQALLQLALGKLVRSITIAGETTEFETGATSSDLMKTRSFVENKIAQANGTYSSRTYASNGGRG